MPAHSSHSEPTQASRRLFFALWPSDEIAGRMFEAGRAAQSVCGGRSMRRDTLHITLAFLGQVPETRLTLLRQVAANLMGPSFSLTLDRLAHWRHNHIVWAGASSVPAELARLASDLAQGLREAGFDLEQRAFSPHVTLVRNAVEGGALPELKPVGWPVSEIVLVESKLSSAGARYEVLERWPLAG